MRSRVKRQGNIKTNEGNGSVFGGCNGNWSRIMAHLERLIELHEVLSVVIINFYLRYWVLVSV
jgi:hypothetical protein